MRLVLTAAIAYLAARLHLLRRRVAHDSATHLLTSSAWMSQAGRRVRRPGGPGVAVLMIDIDRFKAVNDQRGHLAGDAVLASVARTVRTGLRRDDLAARLGGDEFAVLLANVTTDQAAAIAERLRAAVRTACSVTVSVGIASDAPAPTAALRTLLIRADAALYRAKRSGGDAVASAGQAAQHAVPDVLEQFGGVTPDLDRPVLE